MWGLRRIAMYAYAVGGRAEWPDEVRYSRSSLFEDLDLEEVEADAALLRLYYCYCCFTAVTAALLLLYYRT